MRVGLKTRTALGFPLPGLSTPVCADVVGCNWPRTVRTHLLLKVDTLTSSSAGSRSGAPAGWARRLGVFLARTTDRHLEAGGRCVLAWRFCFRVASTKTSVKRTPHPQGSTVAGVYRTPPAVLHMFVHSFVCRNAPVRRPPSQAAPSYGSCD
jgi:hypothetical protein